MYIKNYKYQKHYQMYVTAVPPYDTIHIFFWLLCPCLYTSIQLQSLKPGLQIILWKYISEYQIPEYLYVLQLNGSYKKI